MNRILLLLTGWLIVFACSTASAQNSSYTNSLENAEVGKLPSDLMSLNGDFTVKSNETNKFLELPGAPVDMFALLFGTVQTGDVNVSARALGTAKGRRLPTLGIGAGGVTGHRLQVSPAKKAIEIYRDQELKASVPYEWKAGAWTVMRLNVHKVNDSEWKIRGKAWTAGTPEPSAWSVEFTETEAPLSGRASISGSPFSGTPIWFDDLSVGK